MGFSKKRRIKQVLTFGWKDAGEIAKKEGVKRSRLAIYFDILSCFRKYYVFSRQYMANAFYAKTEVERKELAERIGASNKQSDDWADDYYENRKFLYKYSNFKYETSLKLIWERRDAYRKRYNMGENCAIQYNVIIFREHFLQGTISIGNNVLLAKNVFIDYSGDLTIQDHVKISDGVCIETHSHPAFTSAETEGSKKENLVICDHVNLGTKSIITESCHKIGRFAKIGAGAVVRNNIPPYAIVIGNPAKVINFIFTPEEMVEFENKNYPEEERTSLDLYTRQYNKLYLENLEAIINYNKLKV